MHVLRVECAAERKDRIVAELWERGTTGIVEQDLPGGGCRLDAFFDTPFDAGEFGGAWEAVDDRDWIEVAHAQWERVLVGERFFLVPEWSSEPTPPGRIRLEMHPGQACGTGWGPATQLALEAMERSLPRGAACLDLGTGSGILAVAAARLGAERVYACDIDFDAASAARERCDRERIQVPLFCGSLRSIRDAALDFVVANINAETLISLAPDIRRVLKTGGAIALSGFPERHLARIEAAYGPATAILARAEWRAMIFRS